jgi:hypothetical protein
MNTTQNKIIGIIKTPEHLWEFDLLWEEYKQSVAVPVTLEMFKIGLDYLVDVGDLEKSTHEGSLFYAMPRKRFVKLRS